MNSKAFVTEAGLILSGTSVRPCCAANPAVLYVSITSEHLVMCSACATAFFMTVPAHVRKLYLPTKTYALKRNQRRKDPWAGNPDTDKYWREGGL